MSINTLKNETKADVSKTLKKIFSLGNILAIIAIISGFLIYSLQKNKKEISFSINGFISLLDVKQINNKGITITYDSISLKNLYKVNCSIENTGNVAIKKDDLVDSLKIYLDSNCNILDYTVVVSPENIKLQIMRNRSVLEIVPDLLNPGDEINIAFYYTANNEKNNIPQFSPRIVDGKSLYIDKSIQNKVKPRFYFKLNPYIEIVLVWLCIGVLIIFNIALFMSSFDDKEESVVSKLTFLIPLVSLATLCIIYILNNEFG